jgi:hypothetical protein
MYRRTQATYASMVRGLAWRSRSRATTASSTVCRPVLVMPGTVRDHPAERRTKPTPPPPFKRRPATPGHPGSPSAHTGTKTAVSA